MQAEVKRNRTFLLAIAGAAAALLGLILAGRTVHGQPATTAVMERFVVQVENYPPPNEAQAKILLEGAKAEPLPGGLVQVTEGRLKNLGTNGALIMVVETSECLFDIAQRTVSSSAPLRISAANGDFSLEGQGFILNATNSVLSITNRVHTVIRNRPGHRLFKR
jgi:hypothetical protein